MGGDLRRLQVCRRARNYRPVYCQAQRASTAATIRTRASGQSLHFIVSDLPGIALDLEMQGEPVYQGLNNHPTMEMTTYDYWIVLVCVAVLFGAVSVKVQQKLGLRGLLIAAAVGACLLAAFGYLDWQNQSIKESPLSGYFLGAVGSTVISTYCVHRLRGRSPEIQGMVASGAFVAIWLAAALASLLAL